MQMSISSSLSLLEQRRDDIIEWLDDEAPFAAADQRHLDSDTPERAYWHLGYQAALADIIDLLTAADQKSGSVDTPN